MSRPSNNLNPEFWRTLSFKIDRKFYLERFISFSTDREPDPENEMEYILSKTFYE